MAFKLETGSEAYAPLARVIIGGFAHEHRAHNFCRSRCVRNTLRPETTAGRNPRFAGSPGGMNMRYQIRIGLLLTCHRSRRAILLALRRRFPHRCPRTPAHLTIDDARRIALQNHPHIRAAQSAAAAANEVTVETKSAYYPNLYGSLTGVEADSGSRIAAGALSNSLIYNRFAAGVSVEPARHRFRPHAQSCRQFTPASAGRASGT